MMASYGKELGQDEDERTRCIYKTEESLKTAILHSLGGCTDFTYQDF